MKNALIIFVFTILITAFYNKVGHMVPQNEVHPPEKVEVSASMSTDEMIAVGKKLVDGRCMSCHGIQPRFPNLAGIGGRAGSEREGVTDVEYLAEALYEPNAYVAPAFSAGMTAANKPPIGLSDSEILTVIAYLQSLGGTPSVTMETKLKYQSEDGDEAPKAADAGEAVAVKAELSGEEVFNNYACGACHAVDTPDPLVGPSLYDIGKRLGKGALYEAIMDPDATIAEGFAPGVMGATLEGGDFYTAVSSGELKKLVEYLVSLKGTQ